MKRANDWKHFIPSPSYVHSTQPTHDAYTLFDPLSELFWIHYANNKFEDNFTHLNLNTVCAFTFDFRHSDDKFTDAAAAFTLWININFVLFFVFVSFAGWKWKMPYIEQFLNCVLLSFFPTTPTSHHTRCYQLSWKINKCIQHIANRTARYVSVKQKSFD